MNLLRAVATVSSLTFLSRVLGYARDFFIARLFGAGLATDAFFVAFRIPNLLRRMFAEGAFSQAFVPILSEYRNRQAPEETRALVDVIATTLFLALVLVTAAGMLAAPLVGYLFAPGWFHARPEQFDLTVQMLRITFPYILFISLVALAAGVLNTWSRFAVPAFTPVLLNVSFIVAAAFFAGRFDPPVLALAWAVSVGGALQLALQLPFLARLGLLPRWRVDFRHAGMRRVLKLMGPALFGVSVSQLSLLINTIFASFLVAGSVSWLYYADRLMEFPAGVLGVAVGTILLPSLSRHHASGEAGEYARLLDWGLRVTLLLALPAAAALAVLAVPLVTTLFHYGQFGADDVWMTRRALVAYSVGLVGMILVKILAPGFYARQNVVTPVKIGVLTLAATQLMNLAFIVPLQHAGLALALGLGACLNAALLYRTLRRTGIYQPQPGWGAFAAKTAAAVAAMSVLLHFAMGPAGWWLEAPWQHKVPAIAGLVLAGVAGYALVLLLLGFRWRDFVRREPS
ncbi:MAG: murein biosynthesis integral membrane protein MurJ [Betaproteobacteria bacterium]|nr:murein biosynthesis integral membrane protein MurJ [Betaproteobacteria bacterium]MDH5220018.1 murein biosynthesis integral membrane protein MurJ [Betaproteobacteria bacterium]MDH5350632.1 murein biosynthesis integral membrane protein MurJ [Betaproteobacteria bacterium]